MDSALPLTKLLQWKGVRIYDAVFILHSKCTVVVLLVCTLFLSAKQYFGDPIQCMTGRKKQDFVQSYCWTIGTFLVRNFVESSRSAIAVGVGPTSQQRDGSTVEKISLRYYQWVVIVLILEAVCFYLPAYLWKIWEGQRLNQLCSPVSAALIPPKERVEHCQSLTDYFNSDNSQVHRNYLVKYCICELLNLIVSISNIFFLDYFLNGFWSRYLHSLSAVSLNDWYSWDHNVSQMFPKIAKCTIYTYGLGGSINNYDAVCMLPLNILNEKIFAFLWIWYVLIFLLDSLKISYRCLILMCAPMRAQLLRLRVRSISYPQICRVLSNSSLDVVDVLCNMTGIPHIQYDWHGDEMKMVRNDYKLTVNVAPSVQVLSRAIHEILKNPGFNWKSFTIVHESSSDLGRMQDLLAWTPYHRSGIKVVKFDRTDDFNIVWKIVKNSRERNVVLNCPQDILLQVMNASIYFNMTGMFNNFILTDLDTHLSGIESLASNNVTANITAIRVRPYVPSPARSELDIFQPDEQDPIRSLKAQNLYDAVVLLFNAIKQEFEPDPVPQPRVSCKGGLWEKGDEVVRKMKTINSKDIRPHYKTQKMLINSYGIRDDVNLELYEPMSEHILSVWNKKRGLVSYDEIIANSTKVIKKKKIESKEDKKIKYTVATRYGAPYFMRREEPEGQHFEGNERFEGYAVDLIYELGNILKFEVVFEPVPDNNYGSLNPVTDEWDGIIRQLIDNQAQLGICDLTITQTRRSVVDFTVPFMQLGVQILHYKPPPPKKELFQFLKPFSMDVWFYLLVAMLLMSLVFVVLARLSPNEWRVEARDNDNAVASLQWSLRNSLHLHISSILQVGCDMLPSAGPTRVFTTFWWIFALLMAQTYLAKMTSFITASKMEGSIKSLHDLVHQNKIQFGTIKGGSTSTFFSESNETDYRLAWNKMKSFKPEAFTDDNNSGAGRVTLSKGKYAFLVETPNLQYYLQKSCELTPIGEPFGEKFYGIAVPLNAPYRSELSVALLKLSENGKLYKLKQTWFNNGTKCDEPPKMDDSQMDMHTMRGVFVVLLAGLLVAIVISVAEFFWYIRKMAVMGKMDPKKAMKTDLKFFIRFWKEHKPLMINTSSEMGTPSRGSLLPSSHTTTENTTKDTGKKAKKKKIEEMST